MCPTGIKSLLTLGRSAPPEFSADSLIEVARSNLVLASAEKMALLEEANRRAADAQEKVGLQWVRGGGPYAETHAALLRGMDQVSLRARVVRVMSDIDIRAANRLFAEISLPLTPISDCGAGEVYDLSIYYKTFSYLLNATKEPADLEALLMRTVWATHSSAQLQGLARALAAYGGSPEHIDRAVISFGSRLGQTDNDGPSFSASYANAIPALAALASVFPQGAKERRVLVEGARLWVLSGTKRGVCSPAERMVATNGKEAPMAWTSPVDLFNKKLAPLASESLRLRPSDIGSATFGEQAANPRFSEVYGALRNEQVLLRNDDFKDSPRWKAELDKFVSRVIDWRVDGGDAASYYLERSDLLQSSLQMMARPRIDFSTPVIAVPRLDDPLRRRLEGAILELMQGPRAADLLGESEESYGLGPLLPSR